MTLPITGTLDYLSGITQYMKLEVLVDTRGEQVTSDSWVTSTSTVVNEWEIVSSDPTTCGMEVFSGDSYPQCSAWKRTPRGTYTLECTVTVEDIKTTVDFSAVLSGDNKLVQMQENSTTWFFDGKRWKWPGMKDAITITMTEQSNSPPSPSDFALPSICDGSEGNEVGQCTGTIPSICLYPVTGVLSH